MHKNARSFLKTLFELRFDTEVPAEVTQEQVEEFAERVIEWAAAIDKGPAFTQKAENLRMFVRGASTEEILEKVGTVSRASVYLHRSVLIRLLHERGYPSDVLKTKFTEFAGLPPTENSSEVPEPIAQEIGATMLSDAVEVDALPVEVTAEVVVEPATESVSNVREGCLELCARYWTKEDQEGLRAIFAGKLHEEDDTARFHIRALLAGYATTWGEDQLLSRPQWEALNFLSGYNLDRSQKTLNIKMVGQQLRARYGDRYEDSSAVVADALTILIAKAAPDYQQGWYPHIARPVVSVAAESAMLVPQRPEQAKASEFQKVLVMALKGRPVTQEGLSQLRMHFGEELTDVVPNPRQLNLALGLLRSSVATASQRGTVAALSVNSRDMLLPSEQRLLKVILGDPNNARYPRSLRDLQNDQLSLRDLGIDKRDLAAQVLEVLQKVAHVRSRTNK